MRPRRRITAEFTKAPTGARTHCCEVHQFIRWDNAFASAFGGPPHAGFPATTPANTWIEDRDAAKKAKSSVITVNW